VALANQLCKSHCVTFVTLKPGIEAYRLLSDNVSRLSLGQFGWFTKLRKLRGLLREAGCKYNVITISSSFSADYFNSWCCDLAVTCCSVRGNLPKVYPMTYGELGRLLAWFHLKRLRHLDLVISMTKAMSVQVETYIGKSSPIIGNFVDEGALEKFRARGELTGAYRFIYTGSLVEGKQHEILLDAFHQLQCQGESIKLAFFGDGPLLKSLKEKASLLELTDSVHFHGYVNEPYEELTKADVLVLPSVSEGVSRSVLEALFLGVPCILRDVDGNSELITNNHNGSLFNSDNDLADIMINTAKWSRTRTDNLSSLLPTNFRQSSSAETFLDLVETTYD